MKVAIAAVLCVLSLNAFAGQPHHGREGGVNIELRNDPRAKADATSLSTSDSSAFANGGNATATGGKGGQGGQGGVSSSSSGVVINEAKIPDDVRIRNTPDVTTVPAMTTSSCIKGFGIGAGAAGIGGGFSWSVKDDECEGRAWAAHFLATKRPQMAVNMECQVERVRKANPRECGVK